MAQFDNLSNTELKEKLYLENDPNIQAEVYQKLITNFMRINTDSMLYYAKEFQEFSNTQNDEVLKLQSAYNLGRYYAVKGDPEKAIEYLEDAYSNLSVSDDPSFKGKVIGMMGYVYYFNEQYDTAVKFYQESIEYFEQANDRRSEAIAISTLGSIFYQLEDFESAKSKYRKSLKIKEELKDSILMSTDITNLGLIYRRVGDADSSLIFTLKALQIDEKQNNIAGLSGTYGDLSSIYREKNDFVKAHEYALKSLEKAKEVNSLYRISESYEVLYVVYKEWGKAEEALINYEFFKNYSDSIINVETRKQLVDAQEKYEAEKKEQEIKLLEAENQSANLKASIAIILGVGFVVILSITYWQTSKRKEREKQLELQSVQKELENYGVLIAEKDSFITGVIDQLKSMIVELRSFESKKELHNLLDSLRQNIKLTDDEDHLFKRIEQVNRGFFHKLDSESEELTKGDKRLASLVQMELSNKEIGNIMGINPKSVVQARYRLKKKLKLTVEQDLVSYLKKVG
ncbi:MAG: hypothetical protein BalsKO_32400 [Balneolaceae bacterium]